MLFIGANKIVKGCMCYGLFVCGAYAYRFASVFIPMLFKSRSHIQIKAKCEILVCQVFSSGDIVLAVSLLILLLCAGKWIKLLLETGLAFNLHFQHINMTQITRKPISPFERA